MSGTDPDRVEVEPALMLESAVAWESPCAAVLDGYVDLEDGVVDVRLGGPGGVGDVARESRLLAGVLLRHADPRGGPLFTHDMLRALRASAKRWDGLDDGPDGGLVSAGSDGWAALDALEAALASILPPDQAQSDAETHAVAQPSCSMVYTLLNVRDGGELMGVYTTLGAAKDAAQQRHFGKDEPDNGAWDEARPGIWVTRDDAWRREVYIIEAFPLGVTVRSGDAET